MGFISIPSFSFHIPWSKHTICLIPFACTQFSSSFQFLNRLDQALMIIDALSSILLNWEIQEGWERKRKTRILKNGGKRIEKGGKFLDSN